MNGLLKKEENLAYGEISKCLKVPVEEITLAIDSSTPVSSIEESVYSDSKQEGGLNILDTIASKKDEAGAITNKIAINQVIKGLPDRDKVVILLRYFRDKTQVDVARILGISQVQVSRIEKRILEKLRRELA